MKYLATLLLLVSVQALGQNLDLIDSLRSQIKKASIEDRQTIFLDLSWEYAYSDIDSSESYAIKGLDLAEERNLPIEIARAKSMLAIVYDIKGEVEKSAKTYLEVASFYENSGNQSELSRAYNNLGVLFFYSGDYDQSWKYYRKSIELDSLLGDSIGVAQSLINLAAISNKWEKYDQAYKYLKRGEKIAEGSDDNQWILLSIYEGLSNNYLYRDEYDSGLIYLKKSLPLFREAGDHHSTHVNLTGLILAHTGIKNFEKAKEYLAEAELLTQKYDDINLRSRRNRAAATLFSEIGDYKKAFEYQILFQANNDSITNQERLRITSDLEQKYQAEQRENEISTLKLEQVNARNQRNVTLLALALIIGVTVLLLILYRVKSRSATAIAKSLDEKETLLKEIHHRVKNNLQVVSSLLSMQSRFITDKNALGAVNEGQTRVESMALIHQKLYQENNLSGVNAREYIEDLAEILKQSYETDTDIDFDYKVEELIIDVDTIIPIGLILNELICNSLKHAFPDKEEGNITIELKEETNKLRLEVSDNGIGSEINATEKSFGMVLIDSLAMKLKASLNVETKEGTSVRLDIEKYKLV